MPKIITAALRLESLEVDHLVNRLARAIQSLDIEPRALVAVHADLSLNGVLLVLAVMKLGLKVALCPTREPPAVLNEWLKDLAITKILYVGDKALKTQVSGSVCDIDELWERSKDGDPLPDRSDEFISYLRTSGTTSTPKTALITGLAHRASALAVNAYFGFDENKIWALSLPLYHVSGLSIIFRAQGCNAGIYIAVDHEQLTAALSSGALSHCSVVPAQIKRLLKDGVDISSLQALVVGGDSLAAADRDLALRRGWPLYETYGMCETASMVLAKNRAKRTQKPRSCLMHRCALVKTEKFLSKLKVFF